MKKYADSGMFPGTVYVHFLFEMNILLFRDYFV